MLYLTRQRPTAKQLEEQSALGAREFNVKSHIFHKDKNNTYCNMYRGIVKSTSKRENDSVFDDRWRIEETEKQSHEICNVCLKRLWKEQEDRIKDANDLRKPRFV